MSALVQQVADALSLGLRNRGRASLAVSGGRTPAAFLADLSRKNLAWSEVGVTLVDERWVYPDHVDSNEALVRRSLLQNRAAAAYFTGMKNPARTAIEGEAECEAMLAPLLPVDVAVLGMGDDGHTASLFPQAPQLAAALDLHSGKHCMAINPLAVPHPRMSLTLPALLASRRIVVLITGTGKWAVIKKPCNPGR